MYFHECSFFDVKEFGEIFFQFKVKKAHFSREKIEHNIRELESPSLQIEKCSLFGEFPQLFDNLRFPHVFWVVISNSKNSEKYEI